MLLGKTHWAERMVGEAGVPLDGRIGAELVTMLIEGARQYEAALKAQPDMRDADDLDWLMLSARKAPDSPSAVERLVKGYDLAPERAARLLLLIRERAHAIFEEKGRVMPP